MFRIEWSSGGNGLKEAAFQWKRRNMKWNGANAIMTMVLMMRRSSKDIKTMRRRRRRKIYLSTGKEGMWP